MKSKPSNETTERFFTRPVRYCWSTPDGTIHHGNTVVLSRSKAGLPKAVRRFWKTNTQVSPEAA